MRTRMRMNKRRQRGGGPPQAPPALCQCYEDEKALTRCPRPPLPGGVFCKDHFARCGVPLLSGAEPTYDPTPFEGPQVKRTHNCYTYAVLGRPDPTQVAACGNDTQCTGVRFHQPGAASGQRGLLSARELRTCPTVTSLMRSDSPAITPTTFAGRCPPGTSKIALVVDPGRDYHFYSQMADGWWAHKPGSNQVQRLDGARQPLFNPELAVRDYTSQGTDLNYKDFCGFFCVPRAEGAVHLQQGSSAVAQAGGAPRSGATRRRRRGRAGFGVWERGTKVPLPPPFLTRRRRGRAGFGVWEL